MKLEFHRWYGGNIGFEWYNNFRLFLLGLKKYGKGDWRNISRNYVISRTPTQVASHAQKYFIRQLSGGKDKRRSSIHDITTVNCIEATTLPDNHRPHSEDQSTFLPQSNMGFTPKPVFDWNQTNNGASMIFNQNNGNFFAQSSYGMGSYGLKQHGQNMHRNGFHGSHVWTQRCWIVRFLNGWLSEL